MADPQLLLALPHEGWLHHALFKFLLETIPKSGVTLQMEAKRPLEYTRNLIIKTFLEHEHLTHLVMIDADTIPLKNPLELAALDLDVVGCPTPIFKWDEATFRRGGYPFSWNAFDWDPACNAWRQHMPRKGLQEVDAVGTGCVVIARRVLDGMPHPFEREWDEKGLVTIGSDMLFCRKIKEAGWRCWAHYDYRCRHVKEMELLDMMEFLAVRDIVYANTPNINTPDYWDDQWERREEKILPYYHMLARLCKDQHPEWQTGASVLDFGCGRGDLLEMLGPNAHGVDFSPKAVEICKERGLSAEVGDKPFGWWDTIVATEVMEHLDDDEGMLNRFFEHTDRVIYAVPYNSMPPSVEPEHRRVYTQQYIERITPHIKGHYIVEDYLVVIAERKPDGKRLQQREGTLPQ